MLGGQGRLSLFLCKRKDRNDRCDQRQYKSGEQQELLEGYVIHVITSLRDLRREKKYLLSPVKEEATATVMVYPKGIKPLLLYHSFWLLSSRFRHFPKLRQTSGNPVPRVRIFLSIIKRNSDIKGLRFFIFHDIIDKK